MIIQIIIHLLPNEIDWFEQISILLKRNSVYFNIEEKDKIQVNVTLNLNSSIVDWDNTKIPKQYFIDKFEEIKKYYDWGCELLFDVDENEIIKGVNDKRRHAIENYKEVDTFIYVDNDIFFNDFALATIYQSILEVSQKHDHYIITPQVIKRDTSWDVITHENFLDKEYHYCTKYDHFNSLIDGSNEYRLVETPNIKFGGGWLNAFSGKLLRYIKIPYSFGSYGLDDTFIMECSKLLKNKLSISQFVIEGLIVTENYKYREKIIDKYIELKFNKETSYINIDDNFINEINKVLQK
jgi:hypothetical protein